MNAGHSAPSTNRIYWLCQIAGWSLYSAASALGPALIGDVSWPRATAATAALIAVGIGFSHGLRLFMGRHGWRRMRLGRRVPRLLAADVIEEFCSLRWRGIFANPDKTGWCG